MKAKPLEFGTLIRLVWEDSATAQGWLHDRKSQIGEPIKILSAGYVVASVINKQSDFLVIATSLDKLGGVLSPVTIPWSAVRHLEILEKSANR